MKRLVLALLLLATGLAHAYNLDTVFWYRDSILSGSDLVQVNCGEEDYRDIVVDERNRLLPRDYFGRHITFCVSPASWDDVPTLLAHIAHQVNYAISVGPFSPIANSGWDVSILTPEYTAYSIYVEFDTFFTVGVIVTPTRKALSLTFSFYLAPVEEDDDCSWSIVEHEAVRACE